MKAQFINLGRNKVNKTVEFRSTRELHKKIAEHILSRGWGMEQSDEDPNLYYVTAGFRTVGEVRVLEN